MLAPIVKSQLESKCKFPLTDWNVFQLMTCFIVQSALVIYSKNIYIYIIRHHDFIESVH